MADPLSPDDAEDVSGTKENFIGRVVGSSIDGLVPEAQEQYNSPGQSYESDVPTFDHFMFIEPLDGTYEKNQNVFRLAVRSGRTTKWMVMASHLSDIHGEEWENEVEEVSDIPGFITGRVYEFRDISWMEDEEVPGGLGVTYQEVGRDNEQINEMLVPVREVTDENELADLGVEEAAQADETVEI